MNTLEGIKLYIESTFNEKILMFLKIIPLVKNLENLKRLNTFVYDYN